MANLDDLKLKNGEFTEESQQAVFESPKVFDGLLLDLQSVPFNKCIIFTSSIKHCTDTYNILKAAGQECIQVHSKISASQQAFDMKEFTTGNTVNICVSVGILTKGWDYPPIDLVILNRATTSLPLYLQMIGRGSRTSPNKNKFTVLDYGGNYSRHGLWDANIDWNKKWNTPPKKKQGVAPIKVCPKCDALVAVSVMVCKFCNHIFEVAAPTKEDIENTKLIELTASYRTLIGRSISSLAANELAMYAKLKNKRPYAARVAKSLTQQGFDNYLQEYANAMGYRPGWVDYNYPNNEKIEFHDIILR